jgi:hypothetical protein
MLALLFVAQAALPDIQIGATVEARSLTIEQQGQAKLEVHAKPDAGSLVRVNAPRANGARRLNNVRIEVLGEARIGAASTGPETSAAEPR